MHQAYTMLPNLAAASFAASCCSDEKLLNGQFEGLDLTFKLAALICCHRS